MSHSPGPEASGAVVLGAGYRALSVVRSLGRQGIPVCVVRTDELSTALHSRYVTRQADLRGLDRAQRVGRLSELADAHALRGWMLFPTDDDDVLLLVDHHEELSAVYALTVPARPRLGWALNKQASYAFAAEQGIDHPRTWAAPNVSVIDGSEIAYPAIIKPSYRPRHLAATTPKAWRGENRDELRRAYHAAAALMPSERLLIQEFVPGGGEHQLAYGAVCQNGHVRAALGVRRARQWPREFGLASSFVESIDDTEMRGPSQRLLRAARYTGIIELEYKRDPRSGRLMFLDVNPRPWGWISIGARAGVDFPYLLWRLLRDEEIGRASCRTGVRWVRMSTDVAAATMTPRTELTVSAYFRSLRPPLACAILAHDDLTPALVDAPLLANVWVRRRVRRRRAKLPTTPSRQSNFSPRALIVVENAPVPGDRRVWHESLSLRNAGWEVTVLAPHAWRKERRPRDEVIEGIRVRRFALKPAEESRLGYLGEYVVAMWQIWREVRALAGERPFDVIQACNPPDFLLLAALGQRRRGTRMIFDHHDVAPEMYACRSEQSSAVLVKGLLWLERLAFALCDVALATNGSVGRLAVDRGRMAPENVFVVRNGPMLKLFHPVARDASLAHGRAHLLVYVGLMGPQDGVDHALGALARLSQRRQDWFALFLGDGEMLPYLQALASELGLDSHVKFCGFVSDEEVRRAVSSADVCLAPDPSNRYTNLSTLVKIAEYMVLSRATVSFDLAESRVTAGDAAVFARDNDPADFARLIDELLDDPERRAALGAEGRRRVENELAWECSERALLTAYQRAIQL